MTKTPSEKWHNFSVTEAEKKRKTRRSSPLATVKSAFVLTPVVLTPVPQLPGLSVAQQHGDSEGAAATWWRGCVNTAESPSQTRPSAPGPLGPSAPRPLGPWAPYVTVRPVSERLRSPGGASASGSFIWFLVRADLSCPIDHCHQSPFLFLLGPQRILKIKDAPRRSKKVRAAREEKRSKKMREGREDQRSATPI